MRHLWSSDLTWGNTEPLWRELLHDSGPVLLRGTRIKWGKCYNREILEEGGVYSFFKTKGRASCQSPVGLCQWACCTVTVGNLRARNLWARVSSKASRVTGWIQTGRVKLCGGNAFFLPTPPFYPLHLTWQKTQIFVSLSASSGRGFTCASSVLGLFSVWVLSHLCGCLLVSGEAGVGGLKAISEENVGQV